MAPPDLAPLFGLRARVAGAPALGLVEAVARVRFGLLSVDDILAGADLLALGSRLGNLSGRGPRRRSTCSTRASRGAMALLVAYKQGGWDSKYSSMTLVGRPLPSCGVSG